MRNPFQMPTGCPTMSVTTDILGSLPFCNIPSFAEPTFAPKLRPVVIPDIAPPDTCVCIGVEVSAAVNFVNTPSELLLSGRLAPVTDDCCDSTYLLSLVLDIPCIAFSVYPVGNITMPGDAAGASVGIKMSKTPECEFSMGVDIVVPCIAFSMKSSAKITMPPVPPGTPSPRDAASAKLTMSKRPQECKLSVLLDLKIPCIAFDVEPTGKITMPGDIARPSMDIGLVQKPDECALSLFLDIKIPCIAFSVDPTGTITMPGNIKRPSIGLGLIQKPDTCELSLVVDIKIPPIAFSVFPSATVSMPGDIDSPSVMLDLVHNTDLALLSLIFDLRIPCVAFSVNGVAEITAIDMIAPSATISLLKRGDECALSLFMDIQIPCVPFSFIASTPDPGLPATVSVVPPETPQTMSVFVHLIKTACAIGLGGSVRLRIHSGGGDGCCSNCISCIEGDSDVVGTLYKSIEVYVAI